MEITKTNPNYNFPQTSGNKQVCSLQHIYIYILLLLYKHSMIFLVTAECRLKEQYNSYIQFIFMKHLAASARDQGSFKWDIVQVSKRTVKSPSTTLCNLSVSYSLRPRRLLRVHVQWRLKSNMSDVMEEYQLKNYFDVSSFDQCGIIFSFCTKAAASLGLCLGKRMGSAQWRWEGNIYSLTGQAASEALGGVGRLSQNPQDTRVLIKLV